MFKKNKTLGLIKKIVRIYQIWFYGTLQKNLLQETYLVLSQAAVAILKKSKEQKLIEHFIYEKETVDCY